VIKVILAIISPIVFFGFLEIATRAFWRYEVTDSHVGVVPEETNREFLHDHIIYKTNSHGIRYREIDPIAPTNRRILALGDSFVWGSGLPEETLVTTKIEKILESQLPGILVVNAGICGYNTEDEYEQLLRLAPIYQPDHVLLFFFTNDVLAKKEGGKRRNKYMSWKQNLKEYLRHKSKFCALCYYLYKTRYAARIGVPRTLLPSDYFNLDQSKPGWVAFKKALLDVRDYCKENDISLQFIIIPTLTCLNANYPYAELHGKVKDFSASCGIPTVDLLPVFAPYEPAELWVNPENTHWNDTTTSIAAEAIVRQFNDIEFIRK